MGILEIMGLIAQASELVKKIKTNVDTAKSVLSADELGEVTKKLGDVIADAQTVGIELDAALRVAAEED